MIKNRKMMFRISHYILGIFSLLLLNVNISVAEEAKMGFVDTARVLKQAPQAEQARKKLESEFAPRDKKVIEMQKKLKEMEDELTKNTSVMSELVRKKKERNIISQRRDIKRAKEEFNEDLNIRRNEELSKLQKLIYETIVNLARENKYDIILGDNVLYSSKRVDITNDVLARLRINFKLIPSTIKDSKNN
jgi:outer membrane protein